MRSSFNLLVDASFSSRSATTMTLSIGQLPRFASEFQRFNIPLELLGVTLNKFLPH